MAHRADRDGVHDGERRLRMLNEAVDAALDAGFTGLHTCGDMSWLLRGAEGFRATGMCQYDRSRLPARIVEGAVARHPWMVDGRSSRRNPAYQSSA